MPTGPESETRAQGERVTKAPAPQMIIRAGITFAVVLIVFLVALTTVLAMAQRDIDRARTRVDRLQALDFEVLAKSNEQRIAFRDVFVTERSPIAERDYFVAEGARNESAAKLVAVPTTPELSEKIAASEEAFAAWETLADATLAASRDSTTALPEEQLVELRQRFATYNASMTDLQNELDNNVADYRRRFALTLLGAFVLSGTILVVGLGFVAIYLRSSLRSTRELDQSRRELAVAHAGANAVAQRLQDALIGNGTSSNSLVAATATYLPAEEQLTVGGDWYDVLDLPAGEVVCIVGDVVGHGLDAAATMGQLRALLVGLMLEGHEPGAALEALDVFATRMKGAQNASCAIAVIDPARESVRWARAGHPPLLLLDPDGSAEFLAVPSEPHIGVPRRHPRTTTTSAFPRGSTLLLYTDGLIERRDELITVGLDRLAQAATLGSDLPTPLLCDHLVAACAGGRPFSDDVALIACRSLEQFAPQFSYRLPADVDELQSLRHDLSDWLVAQEANPDLVDDVVLAVNEVATNSIEHGYGPSSSGVVTVTGLRTRDAIDVHIADHGSWRGGFDDPSRGRGVAIARACMDDVKVERLPSGTTVKMRRSLRDSLALAPA